MYRFVCFIVFFSFSSQFLSFLFLRFRSDLFGIEICCVTLAVDRSIGSYRLTDAFSSIPFCSVSLSPQLHHRKRPPASKLEQIHINYSNYWMDGKYFREIPHHVFYSQLEPADDDIEQHWGSQAEGAGCRIITQLKINVIKWVRRAKRAFAAATLLRQASHIAKEMPTTFRTKTTNVFFFSFSYMMKNYTKH